MSGGGGSSAAPGASMGPPRAPADSPADPADMAGEASAAFLRAELQRARQELKAVQDEYDDYSQSSHELELELEQELARAEKRGAQLALRLQQLERELQLARARLEEALAQRQASDGALEALRAELRAGAAARRELEQEQDELQTQVRVLQATEADLQHKLERETEDRVFLLSDQEELQRAHELATERFRTEIMDLKSELFALQQRADTGKSKGGRSARRRGRWASMRSDDDCDDDTEDIDADEDADEDATEEDEDEEDDARLRPRGSTALERDERGREEQLAALHAEVDALSARVQDEADARAALEREASELRAALAQAEAMEAEMTDMTDELILKAQAIRERDAAVQRLQEEAAALRAALAALEDGKSDLAARLEELQRALEDKAEEAARLADEAAAAQGRCEELLEAEAALEGRLEQERRRAEELEATVAAREGQLAACERELAELARTVQADRQEMSQHRRQAEELHDANAELRRQLAQATRRAEELERATRTEAGKAPPTQPQPQQQLDPSRLLLEMEALRAAVASLSAENTRLRTQDGLRTALAGKRVSAELLTESFSPAQLARKYLSERTRNAQLLSRLQTVCGNIQVFCRVRPVIREELERAADDKLAVNVINQADLAAMDVRPERALGGDAGPAADEWKVFTFDRILGPEETQNDVFREVEPIAQAVVDGFKACVFAYGQTGSGKTYTMEGTPSDPGLNYRVVSHIFQSVALKGAIYSPALDADGDAAMDGPPAPSEADAPLFHVRVGVLEVYNDSLRDLVDTRSAKALEIRHDASSGDISVPGLAMTPVSSPEQTIEVLRRAQASRVTGRTDVHMRSSRSHSVVIVEISKRRRRRPPAGLDALVEEEEEEEEEVEALGKLYLVDLAGSERVKKSNVSGEMLREAAHINKSLSALADVMEALDKKAAHVPYRNSKLTFLLQDVLNSSSKTLMIVNVGPTRESASETFRSLQLAERVRNIVVGRDAIVKNKKDILSAKKAFAEIQALKQHAQIAARKLKQAQQSAVAMKRDQKNQSERASAGLASRVKASETQNASLRSQNDALKRINDELGAQLQAERETRQREADQREAAQRALRQLNAKARVSSAQHESLQRQLRDREDEVKKLRQLLTEARQRSTSALIPRLPPQQASSVSSSPPMKKPRSSAEPENNQAEEAENVDMPAAQSTSSSSGSSSSSVRAKLLQTRGGPLRKPLSSRVGVLATNGRSSSSSSLRGADSPSRSSIASDAGSVDGGASSRARAARPSDHGLPRWK